MHPRQGGDLQVLSGPPPALELYDKSTLTEADIEKRLRAAGGAHQPSDMQFPGGGHEVKVVTEVPTSPEAASSGGAGGSETPAGAAADSASPRAAAGAGAAAPAAAAAPARSAMAQTSFGGGSSGGGGGGGARDPKLAAKVARAGEEVSAAAEPPADEAAAAAQGGGAAAAAPVPAKERRITPLMAKIAAARAAAAAAAAGGGAPEPPADEALEQVRALLARGEAVPKQVLMDACEHNRVAVVEFLLASGVSVRDDNDDAFVMAATEGHVELCRLLLDRGGANVNAQACCALINAAYYGEEHVLRLLLERGADVPAYGGDAALKAAEQGHAALVDLLFHSGADASVQYECFQLLSGQDPELEGAVEAAEQAGPRRLRLDTLGGTCAVLGNLVKLPADAVVCSACLASRKEVEGDKNALRKQFLVTRCGHAFHAACLTTWLRTKASCPDCRERIVCACASKNKLCDGSCVGMAGRAEPLGRVAEILPA